MNVRRLLILLLLPALSFAQEQHYGTTASSIRLAEAYRPDDVDKIPIRAGQTITPENVRAAIEALYNTGHYQYVAVDATSTPSGTQLTFNVTHHYFFSTFRLEQENLLDRPLSASLRLPVGEKFSTAVVERIIVDTTQLLEDAGYFNAIVTPEYVKDEDTRLVTVNLNASVRPRAKVGTVDLRGGEQTFPLDELRDALNISPGDDFTADSLAKGRAEIRKKFTDLGFVNTKVDAKAEYDAVTNTVNLDVTVEPGKFLFVDTGGVISTEKIKELLPSYEEGAYDVDLLKEGQARMVEYLQREGYFDATVGLPDVIEAPLDDAIQLNFPITLGERHEIRSVQIRGATFISEERIKPRMKIRQAGFLNRGVFSAALLKDDVEMIRTMYRRAGFEEVQVEPHTDDTGHTVNVIIDVMEGSQRNIAKLVFFGNQDVSEEELRKHVGIREGDKYSPSIVEDARTTLTGLYYFKGFPDIRVEVAVDRDAATEDKQITFQISEGRRYLIGRIIVAGNTRTADKIILRYSRLMAYQSPYNPEAILEAQQRLYATGLFNRVEVVTVEQDNGDQRALLIQVEDAKAILVTPGLGVKEYAGPRVTLDVSHNNLFGLDRSLSLRTRLGLHERQFQATYREPHLFNHDLEGYGSLSFEKTNLRSFEARRFDFSIQILKRLSANKSFLTTANYQTVDLQDIKVNPALRQFPDLKGIFHIARLGASFVGDWRDDGIDPQRGTFTTNTFQVASKAWGSELNFVSVFNQSNYYKPAKGGTIALSSRLGWKIPFGDSREVLISERYFAGGSTTLRGFDLDEAGPPGGGQFMTLGNMEYRVPLKFAPISGIGGALFYDTGNVFERPSDFSLWDFTHSAGAGLRYQTPLGPVRFDVGFNLRPRTRVRPDGVQVREERMKVFITLGQAF